ncbi:MAG TPA: hypothetical protein VF161_12645 [Steroidobacteraceae bacterium]
MDENTRKVVDAIFDYYIEHEAPVTRKELAERFGSYAVRKAIESNDFRRAVTYTEKMIAIESKDYPGFIHSHRQVLAFVPSRSYMRKRYMEARG